MRENGITTLHTTESGGDRSVSHVVGELQGGFSQAIAHILSGEVQKVEEGKENLKKLLYKSMEQALLRDENQPIFPDLLTKEALLTDVFSPRADSDRPDIADHRFKEKFSRYFERFYDIIIRRITLEIKEPLSSHGLNYQYDGNQLVKSPWVSSKTFSGTIDRVVSELLQMIYIFGDNLDGEDFGKIFLQKQNNFGDIKKQIHSNYTSLGEKEYNYSQPGNPDNNYLKKLDTKEPRVLKMYKHIIAQCYDEIGMVDLSKISEKLDSHFIDTFSEIALGFHHWYKTARLSPDFLVQLDHFRRDVWNDINILRNLGIEFTFGSIQTQEAGSGQEVALQNIFCKNQIFGNEKCNTSKGQSLFPDDEKNLIEKFLFDEEIFSIDHYLEGVQNHRNQHREKYNKKYINKGDIDITNVGFKEWYNVQPSVRRELFFKTLLVKNNQGDITFFERFQQYTDFSKTENKARLEKMLEKPFKKQKAFIKGDDDEKFGKYSASTIGQFSTILNRIEGEKGNSSEKMLNFIGSSKNDIDLLVSYWWECLKGDFIESREGSAYKDDDGNILKENFDEDFPQHGVLESIITQCNENNTSLNKVYIAQGIHNSSAWNDEKVFEGIYKAYTQTPLDLQKCTFSDIKGNIKQYKQFSQLYITKDIKTADDITEYTELGMSIAHKLLQGSELSREEKTYEKMLQNIGMNENNHIKFLNGLIDFLKYVLYLCPSIEKMQIDGDADRGIIQGWKEEKDFIKIFGGGDNNIASIGPEKDLERIAIKVVDKYDGDMRDMGDITRMMAVCNDVTDVSQKIASFIGFLDKNLDVKQIAIEDSTGNFTEKAPKASGYRDVTLSVKLKTGNTVEVQFHYKDFLEFKKEGDNLEGVFFENIKAGMYLAEGEKLFSTEDYQILLEAIQKSGKTVPSNFFTYLCDIPIGENPSSDESITGEKLSSDALYKIIERLDQDEDVIIISKLQKIEAIGYDIAGGKTLQREMMSNLDS